MKDRNSIIENYRRLEDRGIFNKPGWLASAGSKPP